MSWLRAPGADDDKRSMGVLGVVTGSERYPGAAVLGVEAAWRAGVGTVRLWAPRRVQDLVLARRPETVCHELEEEPTGVDAWLLGSGQDSRERPTALRTLLDAALGSGAPCAIDAGALDLAGQHRGAAVVTPHAGELARMLRALGRDVDADAVRAAPVDSARSVADALDVVVLLKGATTHVVAPGAAAVAVRAPTHRLAVAGSGDVLAGLLGAALASTAADAPRGERLASLVAAGVRLQGRAAALAAEGDVPIAALDVAERLADAQR
ncbi:ADP-dependent NAD(P)H-hydrate dehydratase [Agrococcus sp. DT81.2]|uniref:ADP-dependent NAD(P)H-hydrate dehydratase n=1 Tax=Agrococcus sp. DT81.2 TaxID=3393414 RepID=UPI003CE44D5F